MSPSDPSGQVALMLCESLLHLLVEERVIRQEKAMEAIEGAVEVMRETAREKANPWQAARARAALSTMELIRNSFAAKSPP